MILFWLQNLYSTISTDEPHTSDKTKLGSVHPNQWASLFVSLQTTNLDSMQMARQGNRNLIQQF